MPGRIVVFGATGYTGRLVVAALAERGLRPVVAGRDRQRADAVAAAYGGLEVAVADVARPASVRALVERGDVLVSTVGPFLTRGRVAVDAAIDAGAHYVDSTGEAPFIRWVHGAAGPRAREAGVVLLTAYGFDFVPGNLAGALALREAGAAAARLDVGYFFTGRAAMSSGTFATGLLLAGEASHALRGGRLVELPMGRAVREFDIGRSRRRTGVLFGGTEPLALPETAPGLRDVTTYLGAAGPKASRAAQAVSYATPVVLRVPGAGALIRAAGERAARRTGQGPAADARARSGSVVVAEAYDDRGRLLAAVRLVGPNPYDLTGAFLADAAARLATGQVAGAGALGPVQALGLEELESACAAAGLRRGD